MTQSDLILGVVVVAVIAVIALGFTDNGAGDAPVDPAADPGTDPAPSADTSLTDSFMAFAKQSLGLWHPPAQYAQIIANAESANGIPTDMLARLLWQESRYRVDIITGATRSPAGALGIAQFMPATAAELGIDPLDPVQAINGAARYLVKMYRQAGTWSGALASYNWGIGNVKSWQKTGLGVKGQPMPAETYKYFSEILADVNASTGQTLA